MLKPWDERAFVDWNNMFRHQSSKLLNFDPVNNRVVIL